MTLGILAHLFLAASSGTMAFLLWHKAVPRMKHARGDWHGMCVLLLGFVLAMTSGYQMELAWLARPVEWQPFAIGAMLLAYSGCRLRHALRISDCTWKGSKS